MSDDANDALKTSLATERLIQNIRQRLATSADIPSVPVLAQRSGVDATTINRVLRRANTLTLLKLESIAAAFGVEPWALIAPEEIVPDVEWPFELINKERYLQMTDVERGAVQSAILDKLHELESIRMSKLPKNENSDNRQEPPGPDDEARPAQWGT